MTLIVWCLYSAAIKCKHKIYVVYSYLLAHSWELEINQIDTKCYEMLLSVFFLTNKLQKNMRFAPSEGVTIGYNLFKEVKLQLNSIVLACGMNKRKQSIQGIFVWMCMPIRAILLVGVYFSKFFFMVLIIFLYKHSFFLLNSGGFQVIGFDYYGFRPRELW